MSKETTPKKKKKSSGSKAPLIIVLILVIGGVAASNFVGPKKGWIAKLTGQTTVAENNTPKETDTGDGTTVNPVEGDNARTITTSTSKQPPKENPTQSKEPLSGLELKLAEFVKEYLDSKKGPYDETDPKNANKYFPITTPNTTYSAKITKVDRTNLVLHIQQKKFNAKHRIHYTMLQPRVRDYFFRERAALKYADNMLEKYLKDQNAIEVIPEPEPIIASSPTKEPNVTAKAAPRYSSALKKYDVSIQASSKRLAHAALEVNNYLNNQVRLAKKKDGYAFAKVSDCHAKQHGSKSVFYLYVTSGFVNNSREYKFQVIDGIRRFWALRCMSNGVAGSSKALLCVVHNGKVVGGSKLDNAEDVFIN